MDVGAMVERMASFGDGLRAILVDVSSADARWKPEDGAWSILEVVAHLADEETRDFRVRVDRTLNEPGSPWEPIDPERWAVERRYNEMDLATELDRFADERARSLAWLRSSVLGSNPDWEAAYEHPKIGRLRVGDLMTAWCAHDALHLRQIAKRLFQLAERDGGAYGSRYAGDW